MAARVHEESGAWPTSITLRADPRAPGAFALGRDRTVFVDPWTGVVLGEGSKRVRAFFHTMTDWHRWLGAHGDARPVGRAITGASNLLFVFLLPTGSVLWWPKGTSGPRLRRAMLFQRGLAGRARDFNWHNVFGFWSLIPLVIVAASAVVISYPRANDVVQRLAGSEPQRRGPAGGRAGAAASERAKPAWLERLDAAWATAERQVAGWQSLTLRIPPGNEPWSFSIDTSTGARRPSTRSQLTVDRRTGEVVRYEPYAAQPAGRKAIGWLRFLHTGEAFGLVGQTVAALASAGAVMLVWTGLSLALRRCAAWRRRRARAAAEAPDGLPAA
jgi:uncharacterized iron-regulated membrane protein